MSKQAIRVEITDGYISALDKPKVVVSDDLFDDDLMLESVTVEEIELAYLGDELADTEEQPMLEAISTKRIKLAQTMRAYLRVLNRALGGTGISAGTNIEGFETEGLNIVGGAIIGRVRRVNNIPILTAQIPLSDGQTTSIIFHSPTAEGLKIKNNDLLVAFQFLINKRDVTHVVAPIGGRDVTLNQVCQVLSNLIERNSKKFQKAQERQSRTKQDIERYMSESDRLEKELSDVLKKVEVAQKALKEDRQSLSEDYDVLSQRKRTNKSLVAELKRLQAAAAKKSPKPGAVPPTPPKPVTEPAAAVPPVPESTAAVPPVSTGKPATDKKPDVTPPVTPTVTPPASHGLLANRLADGVDENLKAVLGDGTEFDDEETAALTAEADAKKALINEGRFTEEELQALLTLTGGKNVDTTLIPVLKYAQDNDLTTKDFTVEEIAAMQAYSAIVSPPGDKADAAKGAIAFAKFQARRLAKEGVSKLYMYPSDVKAGDTGYSVLPRFLYQAISTILFEFGKKNEAGAFAKKITPGRGASKKTQVQITANLLEAMERADDLLAENGYPRMRDVALAELGQNAPEDKTPPATVTAGSYDYAMTQRGAGPGSVPEDNAGIDAPDSAAKYGSIAKYGVIHYARKLTDKEAAAYDLVYLPRASDIPGLALELANGRLASLGDRVLKLYNKDESAFLKQVKTLYRKQFPATAFPEGDDVQQLIGAIVKKFEAETVPVPENQADVPPVDVPPVTEADKLANEALEFILSVPGNSHLTTLEEVTESLTRLESAAEALVSAGRYEENEQAVSDAADYLVNILADMQTQEAV